MAESRMPTPVDDLAEQYVHGWAELNPIEATFAGLLADDDRLPDFTPGWWQSVSEHRRQTLAALHAAEPVDATDRTTIAAMREEFSVREELHAIGADESLLDVISSPVQLIRDVFDLTPTNTVDEWTTVATRLRAVPTAVDGYIESL